MGQLRLDSSRDGLPGLPAGLEPVARDELGDVLAVDARGKVWSLEHGRGAAWKPVVAFRSLEQLHAFHAFQAELEIPANEPLEALRARDQRLREFLSSCVGAPFAKAALRAARDDLREQIRERRFWSSPRGASLAARQKLGQRCERALSDAGAPGTWLVRAHVEDSSALVVVGPFATPWTPASVTELLQPLLGPRLHLLCRDSRPNG